MKEGKVLSVLKKSLFIMLTAVLVFAFSSTGAKAASKAASKTPGLIIKDSSMWLENRQISSVYSIANIKKKDKIVKVKSSNTKVATAEATTEYKTGLPALRVIPHKAGNTKITIVIKRGGKTYTSGMTVHVVNYNNPLKSFKIGSKEYADLLNETSNTSDSLSGKAKVKAVAKGEWKVTGLYTYDNRKGKGKSYKNGKNVNLDKATQVSVLIQNKKNKKIQLSVHVLLNRTQG